MAGWLAVLVECVPAFALGYYLTRKQARDSRASHNAEMAEIRAHNERMRVLRAEIRTLRRG